MVETLKYSRIFIPDLDVGTGSKEVQLVDGRVVLLNQVHWTGLLPTRVQVLRATNGESQLIAGSLLPSESRIIGVTYKILTPCGKTNSLTTVNIGRYALEDHWGNAKAVIDGTVTTFKDFTEGDYYTGATAEDATVTAVAGTFDGTGRIELKCWYDKLIH